MGNSQNLIRGTKGGLGMEVPQWGPGAEPQWAGWGLGQAPRSRDNTEKYN